MTAGEHCRDGWMINVMSRISQDEEFQLTCIAVKEGEDVQKTNMRQIRVELSDGNILVI